MKSEGARVCERERKAGGSVAKKTFHVKCFPWSYLRNDAAQIDTPLIEAQMRGCFWGAREQ